MLCASSSLRSLIRRDAASRISARCHAASCSPARAAFAACTAASTSAGPPFGTRPSSLPSNGARMTTSSSVVTRSLPMGRGCSSSCPHGTTRGRPVRHVGGRPATTPPVGPPRVTALRGSTLAGINLATSRGRPLGPCVPLGLRGSCRESHTPSTLCGMRTVIGMRSVPRRWTILGAVGVVLALAVLVSVLVIALDGLEGQGRHDQPAAPIKPLPLAAAGEGNHSLQWLHTMLDGNDAELAKVDPNRPDYYSAGSRSLPASR